MCRLFDVSFLCVLLCVLSLVLSCDLNDPEDTHPLVLQTNKEFHLKHVFPYSVCLFAYLPQCSVLAVLGKHFVLLQHESSNTDNSFVCLSGQSIK